MDLAILANTVIGRVWPDKTEAEKQQLAAAVQLVQGQLEINKVEAASSSVFVSGWRPFIGWVCGAACAWNWIGLPILRMYVPDLTPANLTEMMPVLMGLLGLGALRTVEKINGVASR
jgi:hypothetical protein